MTKENEVYKCDICGNVVSVVEAHEGELVCCGQPMTLQEAKFLEDEGNEKHVPVIEKTQVGVIVRVGSNSHPMTEEHFITYIELWKDGKVLERVYLQANEEPMAEFIIENKEGIHAKAYCNLHGLWKSK